MNLLGQPLDLLGQPRVRLDQIVVPLRELFAVFGVGAGMGLVALGLTGLREQDER